ncbi:MULTISPECIES: helix-turn-helix transcriptional regulator [Neomoorella]|uniref:helix-turn-helix transcriptional regulator n=1 Tax=Neomoorella TaxID=44260 RepID=UPI0010FFBE95|nr:MULTISPECIES: helix-turn-helix transcriptional regulator [unclassified Moorella (in: firmicutes)]MDK2815819.1 DeoR family transcriptional regulator, catabolite repression regulator [Moorella sp. (in: firmicutes)]MDK2895596.1 DeoR family transcriptional regulator, catabolite repression regulator [Moorella sp. (in: firmicutes)]GEA16491.1 transcriptional regulator [Moorella sp. E308F]GEA17330.1 transcriptional regulator [Moorella sp. E306M]
MQLSPRQQQIVAIVKRSGPITSQQIAEELNLTRAALRPDLAVLTMSGILEARPRVGYFLSTKPSQALVAEEIKKIKVGDVKGLPRVIRANASVYDAIVNMFIEDVGTLMVVDEEGHLEGVISRKDLLKAAIGGGDLQKMPVSVVMTRMPNIICTTPEETVLTAARKIIEHEVDALPVVRPVDGQGKKLEVIGRLTKTTITRLFVELGEGGR